MLFQSSLSLHLQDAFYHTADILLMCIYRHLPCKLHLEMCVYRICHCPPKLHFFVSPGDFLYTYTLCIVVCASTCSANMCGLYLDASVENAVKRCLLVKQKCFLAEEASNALAYRSLHRLDHPPCRPWKNWLQQVEEDMGLPTSVCQLAMLGRLLWGSPADNFRGGCQRLLTPSPPSTDSF